MFGLFKNKSKAKSTQPESRWSVSAGGPAISVTDAEGNARSVSKSDLSGIAIETNDSGPWGADVWWLLFGADDRLACAFPQGATGEEAFQDFLKTLPAVDYDQMVRAMSSTDNGIFPAWRKPT